MDQLQNMDVMTKRIMTKWRVKGSFVLRSMLDQHIVMPRGEQNSRDCIVLNDSGAFLFQCMQEPKSKDELRDCILAEYDATPEMAEKVVEVFLKKLKDINILDELRMN